MNWKIGHRLGALIALFAIGLIALMAYQVTSYRSQLYAERETQLRQVVDVAIDILTREQALVSSGEKTLDEAQASAQSILRDIRYNGDEYLWINDMRNNMIMHPISTSLEGKNLKDLQDINGKHFFQEFIKVVNTKGGGLVDYYWPKPGSDAPVLKYSYVEGFKPWGYVIGSGIYVDDVQAIFWSGLITTALIVAFILALCGGAAFLLMRSITRPTSALVSRMEELRKGDTAAAVPGLDRGDEIGQMAQAVEAFREAAIEREQLLQAQDAGQEANQLRQQTLERLIVNFRQATTKLLQNVDTTNGDLNRTAETLTQVAGASSNRTHSAANAAEDASGNVQSVAGAAEELAASIGEISRQVSQTTDVVHRATDGARQSNEKVESLALAANKIGEVVTLIQAIAEQTNLLALNATIEAARAGDAGRGFAVVASEVKELATQTSKATEEIGAQIAAIQGSTGEAVNAIGAIAKTMEEVNGYTSAIAAAVEEQGAATSEISRNIQLAAQGTLTVVNDISDLAQTVTDTNSSASSVTEASKAVSSTSHQLKSEIETFLHAIEAA